jgi:hypothetical protein
MDTLTFWFYLNVKGYDWTSQYNVLFSSQHLINILSLIISFFQTWNMIDANYDYKWTSRSFEAFTKVKSIILITIYSVKPILSFSMLHSILFFIQLLMSLLIIIATYTKAIKQINKWQISSQFQVGEWTKNSNSSQNITCYKKYNMCL